MRQRTSDYLLDYSQGQALGIRGYMASVYWRMAGGLAASAGAAWLVAHVAALSDALFNASGLTALGWVVTFAPLALVLILGGGVGPLSAAMAGTIFALFAVLVGLSLGGVLLAYTGSSVVLTFCAVAAGFTALAWVGSVSRRDLSGFGTFLTVGLAGLVVAMIVNLFVRSTGFDLALSAIGVLLFAGLTAFDAQRVKQLHLEAIYAGSEWPPVFGALTLYLDFLNLFLFVLRFTGQRRR